jgi:hypothetical protein
MKELTEMLLEVLNELCRIFGRALMKADKRKWEQGQVQEDIFNALESSYAIEEQRRKVTIAGLGSSILPCSALTSRAMIG